MDNTSHKSYIIKNGFTQWVDKVLDLLMILPQVHLRKPCYDLYFL